MKYSTRLAFVGAGAALALGAALGGPAAIATVTGGAEHARTPDAKAQITGVSVGGGCRMGYDTQSSTLTPPDDSTANNPPAASVTITKPCAGAAVGRFTTETYTVATGGYIHLDMRATCTGTGGYANACTVGTQIFAAPGHTFLRGVQEVTQTHAMNMVWTDLPKGVWLFEVLPGGDGMAGVGYRTFTVEAYKAG